MSTWELLAELALEIDDYALEPLRAERLERLRAQEHGHPAPRRRHGRVSARTSPTTRSTRRSCRTRVPSLPLAGRFTLASFSEHLAGLSLFPEPPQREVSARYRTWAYESAALDLALRQAGSTLHAALDREPEAGAVRGVAAPRRAALAAADRATPGGLPRTALQARPHELLG